VRASRLIRGIRTEADAGRDRARIRAHRRHKVRGARRRGETETSVRIQAGQTGQAQLEDGTSTQGGVRSESRTGGDEARECYHNIGDIG
jgi:hypothetical protein